MKAKTSIHHWQWQTVEVRHIQLTPEIAIKLFRTDSARNIYPIGYTHVLYRPLCAPCVITPQQALKLLQSARKESEQ